MDRLVCGDVGFGKTEVALRAAFVAVTGGKQVAVSGAHHAAWPSSTSRPWCDRFGKWPVKVAEMSRFRVGQGDQRGAQGRGRRHGGHRGRHAQAAV